MQTEKPMSRDWSKVGVFESNPDAFLVVTRIEMEWEHLEERAETALKTPEQLLDEVFGARG